MTSQNGENKSLLERVEMPEQMVDMMGDVPAEARQGLARLEQEFARAEVEILRNTTKRLRPLYERRTAFVSSTPAVQAEFWRRVFATAPTEVDSCVLPFDAQILGQSLRNLSVERFEVDENGNGDPRSLRFIFEFDQEENQWFEGNKITKDFYWRKEVGKTKKGKRVSWEGFVSQPVRIAWKEGMDPTKGLLDAACDLADAEEKAKSGESKLSVKKRKDLKAYEKLVKMIAKLEAEEENGDGDEDGEDPMTVQNPTGMSFFAWFGYRGRDVTAEQTKDAEKTDNERFEKMKKGEDVELSDDEADEDDEFDGDDGLEDAEIFPDGEELTTALANDLFPNALKYYQQSFDVASDFDSDVDLKELEGELDDLEGEDDDDDEDEGSVAGEEEDEDEPPRKKART